MIYPAMFFSVGTCGKLWIIIYLAEAVMFATLIVISLLCIIGLTCVLRWM